MKKLISTDKAGLRSPYEGPDKDLDIAIVDVQEETGIRYGKPQVLSSAEFNEAYANADADVKELIEAGGGGGGTGVKLTVNPSTSDVTYAPSAGEYYNEVEAKGVTSTIDANIDPANIREGVTILGVTGTYVGGGIIERATLDEVTALEGDLNIELKYEYREPGEYNPPGTPNWKELPVFVTNETSEALDLRGSFLAVRATADDITYSGAVPFIYELSPDVREEMLNLMSVVEPEEGQTDPNWETLNRFIEAAKEGDISTTTDILSMADDVILNGYANIPQDVSTNWGLTIDLLGNKDDQGTHTEDIAVLTFSYIGAEEPAPEWEDFGTTLQTVLIHYINDGDNEEIVYYPLPVRFSNAETWAPQAHIITGSIPQELYEGSEDWYFGVVPDGAPGIIADETGGDEIPRLEYPYEATIVFTHPIELTQDYTAPTFADPTDPEKVITPDQIVIDPAAPNELICKFNRPATDWVHNFTGTFTVASGTVVSLINGQTNALIEIDDFFFNEHIS